MLLRNLIFAMTLAMPVLGQEPNPNAIPVSKQESVQSLAVTAAIERGVSSLHFDWGEKKPALAVVRDADAFNNEKWWIVFDENAIVTLPNLKEYPIQGIKSIETIPTKENVVLQVVTDPYLTPAVVRDGNRTQVVFQAQSSAPSISHKASIRLPQTKGEELVVSLESTGKQVRFTDPHTGYSHIVIPTHQIGFGVDRDQAFPEFRVLESVQGVGFQLLKDDLTIQATQSQVSITHPDGLAISLRQERDEVRDRTVPISFFADARDLDWASRRQKINDVLLDLPHDQHAPGELEIAWMLLSYGQSAEALGYLTHLAQERPSVVDLPLYRILRGMGSLLLNRLPEAENYLRRSREEPEIQIWLSLIHALQQPHYFASSPIFLAQLRSQFQLAKVMIQSYPKPLHTQMATLFLMAGIALHDLETLTGFLDQEARPENISAGEVYDLARARVLLSQSKPDGALQILGELMEKASSPIIRSVARFDYLTHRLETKMMKEEDVLPQLETLQAQWHGGWFGREVATYLAKRRSSKG
jgi:hypothetical protein